MRKKLKWPFYILLIFLAITPTMVWNHRCVAQGVATPPYIWKNVEIVGGGFVTGIIFNPTEPGLVYARTDIGGAYRWNPGTGRWIPLNDWVSLADWNLMGIESLAADPVETNRVYLAAGTYTNGWSGPGTMLRSSDRGQTWQRTDLSIYFGGNEEGRSMGERLAVNPSQNSTIYFGSRKNGLWRSTDYGVNWGRVEGFPVTGDTSIGLSFVLFNSHGGAIYVGVATLSGPTLYRSLDNGSSWLAVSGAPTGYMPHHGALASNGTLFLTPWPQWCFQRASVEAQHSEC